MYLGGADIVFFSMDGMKTDSNARLSLKKKTVEVKDQNIKITKNMTKYIDSR